MKNKKFLFISLLILAIGFAAVSNTLYISGNLVFGTNKNDFEVYFSGAIIDDEDKSNEVILSDKKHIEYETKELKKLGDTSVLEFEVTNNSTQYDAKVSISCTLSDNEYITYTTDSEEYVIPAQTRESGKVIVELIKASTSILNPTISCELVSTAEERNATAETVITDSSYEITGTLTDEEGNILANKNLVVYSETPHYVTTDDYGFFYVNGLEKGSHEIYYVNTEDATGKTKEEVKELSLSEAKITTSSTKINFENIKLNDFKINEEKEEEINITLDADTGSIDSNTLKINKYEKGSELPTPIPKSSNYEFLGWYDGEKKITNNTIITREMSLVAKWNKKCQYDEGFIWNYDYTGSSQTFTSPCDGIYKLELWGAQGGSTSSVHGGYGAYVSGNILLYEYLALYIEVGEKGKGETSNYFNYNNGSSSIYNSGNYGTGPGWSTSGGGSTDVRLIKESWNSFNSIKSRIMVAAGGGGSNGYHHFDNGGAGGGLIGYNGTYIGKDGTCSTGGTQTSGGQNGGGSNTTNCLRRNQFGNVDYYDCNVAKGGNGYYSGGASPHGGGTTGSGAGGSSFISGHTGCDAIKEESTSSNIIHTGQSVHYSGLKFTNTKMIDGTGYDWTTVKGSYVGQPQPNGTTSTGHSGNGYARITLVSID